METPAPEADGSELRHRAAIPGAITAWIAISAICWVLSTSSCSGDCHNQSIAASQAQGLLGLIAVLAFMIGPLVIALLALWLGRSVTGFAFLAIFLAVGAITVSSDSAIQLLLLA